MLNASGGIRIVIVRYIVEINERIVPGMIIVDGG
jgi:hypothetical protein